MVVAVGAGIVAAGALNERPDGKQIVISGDGILVILGGMQSVTGRIGHGQHGLIGRAVFGMILYDRTAFFLCPSLSNLRVVEIDAIQILVGSLPNQAVVKGDAGRMSGMSVQAVVAFGLHRYVSLPDQPVHPSLRDFERRRGRFPPLPFTVVINGFTVFFTIETSFHIAVFVQAGISHYEAGHRPPIAGLSVYAIALAD